MTVTPNINYNKKSSIGTTAVQLTTTSTKLKNSIMLLAPSANTGTVYVGTSSGVTSADGFPLSAGAAIALEVDNANKIWLIGSTSNQVISWIGS